MAATTLIPSSFSSISLPVTQPDSLARAQSNKPVVLSPKSLPWLPVASLGPECSYSDIIFPCSGHHLASPACCSTAEECEEPLSCATSSSQTLLIHNDFCPGQPTEDANSLLLGTLARVCFLRLPLWLWLLFIMGLTHEALST